MYLDFRYNFSLIEIFTIYFHSLINNFAWNKKIKIKMYLKIYSLNEIYDNGAAKIGEGLSKLLNLTTLNLDFG
jgi:hypothetical protein